MAKEFYRVKSVGGENKYLPTPLIVGEICQLIPDPELEKGKFIKIYHNNGKNISVFSTKYFEIYKPKDKTELINLIKNKGRL